MARRRLTLKRIDPWSVLKFGFVANLALLAIWLLGAGIIWFFVRQLELVESVCQIAGDVGFTECGVNGGNLFRALLLLGLLGVVVQTGLVVFLAFLHNLIADLVGGIGFTYVEEGGSTATSSSTSSSTTQQQRSSAPSHGTPPPPLGTGNSSGSGSTSSGPAGSGSSGSGASGSGAGSSAPSQAPAGSSSSTSSGGSASSEPTQRTPQASGPSSSGGSSADSSASQRSTSDGWDLFGPRSGSSGSGGAGGSGA